MATINLGSIKFNWKGTYAGGTAYVVDDVVSYNGSSYICKLASTGNLPTNTTYWDQMSSAGTNGTDGTDLTTTLTTQGDLIYRDGSGLQRLGAGTSGQVLQTGGTGANPSWGTVSSDYVKLYEGDLSGATEYDFEYFDSTIYSNYELYVDKYTTGSDGGSLRLHFRTSSGKISSSDYNWAYIMTSLSSGGGTTGYNGGSWGTTFFQIGNGVTSTNQSSAKVTFHNIASTGTAEKPTATAQALTYDAINATVRHYNSGANYNTAINTIGFTLATNNANNWTARVALYGVKK